MNDISKSPDRHTFQAQGYLKRCEENGEEPRAEYLGLYETAKAQALEQEANDEWKKNNLEYDLRTTDWILAKARASDTYAQNIYAALCNQDWQKRDVWPILADESWSCSWRYAGGIVADMRQQGDYIDWYCSGIGDGLGNGDSTGDKGYVSEGTVTQEIEDDFYKLGWIPFGNKDQE